MALEIEVKFPVTDFSVLRCSLQRRGALFLTRLFERNVVFDSPDGVLRARGALLRLRRDNAARLTLKLPSPGGHEGFKVRREIETTVGDFDHTASIFTHLGYTETMRYEKLRETWRHCDALVCLDELPFGLFVEIEGAPDAIAYTAGDIGLDMADASTASYHDLHLAHLDARGLPRRDSFEFSPEERSRLESLAARSMSPG